MDAVLKTLYLLGMLAEVTTRVPHEWRSRRTGLADLAGPEEPSLAGAYAEGRSCLNRRGLSTRRPGSP